jgi:hypothetical protein
MGKVRKQGRLQCYPVLIRFIASDEGFRSYPSCPSHPYYAAHMGVGRGEGGTGWESYLSVLEGAASLAIYFDGAFVP